MAPRPPSSPLNFNRTLRRLADEFREPQAAALRDELHALVHGLTSRGLELRLDHGRDWENVHCLLELQRCFNGFPAKLVEIGGGNSPVAIYLARAGCDVTVLDVDRGALAALEHNARELELSNRLRGVHGGIGGWPLGDGEFDAALSISVVEGILRSKRREHFAELSRVLAPGGHALMTFDFGPGSRFVSDAPHTAEEVERDLVGISGLELVGEEFCDLGVDPHLGPPIKVLAPTADGFDQRVVEYTFGAVHLRRGNG